MLVTIDVPNDPQCLRAALGGLVALDRVILRRSDLPSLYDSGVRYRPEASGQERWRRIDEVFRLGYGDCEDLTAGRVAELQLQGELAYQDVKKSGFRKFHAKVLMPDGTYEDPSRILGMKVR